MEKTKKSPMISTFKKIVKDWLKDCGLYGTDHYFVSIIVENDIVTIYTNKVGAMIGKKGEVIKKYRKIFGYYEYKIELKEMTDIYTGLKGA